jgi:hypothetical protein
MDIFRLLKGKTMNNNEELDKVKASIAGIYYHSKRLQKKLLNNKQIEAEVIIWSIIKECEHAVPDLKNIKCE